MKYKGINHLAMATGDMNKTIYFWRDLLGMRLVGAMGEPGFRQYYFEISADDMIVFFEWPGVEPMPEKDPGTPVSGPFAFDHVSLGVENKDDLWEMKDKLHAADIWVSEVVDHGFILSIYTFDPNDIPLEFSWKVKGIDIRKNPCFSDAKLVEAALEGSEVQPHRWPEVISPGSEEDKKIYPGDGSELFKKVDD